MFTYYMEKCDRAWTAVNLLPMWYFITEGDSGRQTITRKQLKEGVEDITGEVNVDSRGSIRL